MTVRMKTKKEAYVFDYPAAVDFANMQNSVFWLADEIKVDKDVQDIMVNITDAERHGVITVLKLFTLYELIIGTEYWGNRVMKSFPRPDIQMMASSFSFTELNIHAPFYNKLNEALHLNTEEFYTSYVDDPYLKARMKFVEKMVCDKNDLLSLAVFSMLEGVVLYSSFAFLKHFKSLGKNYMNNVVSGINFSARDENLHCLGSGWLYRTLKSELLEAGEITEAEIEKTEEKIIEASNMLVEHEDYVVDMIFEKGNIDGITDVQLKHFIRSRVNLCLQNVGIKKIHNVTYNPIADWFYDSINSYQFHDFFNNTGNAYNRNWSETEFKW